MKNRKLGALLVATVAVVATPWLFAQSDSAKLSGASDPKPVTTVDDAFAPKVLEGRPDGNDPTLPDPNNRPDPNSRPDPNERPDRPHRPRPCHLVTIARGEISGFGYDAPGFLGQEIVIRDRASWRAFWARHTSNLDPAPPAPRINFRHDVVIVAIQGQQSSGGGPRVEILGIERDGPINTIVVLDDERGGPLDVVTNPYHIVKAPRRCLPCRSIAFRHVAPRSGALMAGGVVVGGVNETGPRRPLPGARILVESQNSAGNPVARRTVSGLDGSYLFVDLPPGAYLATGMQRGFASGQARFVGAPGERVFRPIFLQRLVPSPQPEPNEPEPNQP